MDAENSLTVLPHVPERGTTRRWFVDGDAWLAIDMPARSDPQLDALHDAALLGDVDPLLQQVARLCNRDFDWHPTSDGHALGVTVSRPSDLHIALALPESLQKRLLSESKRAGSPAVVDHDADRPAGSVAEHDADRALGVVAHRQPARVILDRFMLEPADRERLVPGALLLLPTSFEPQWRATLALGTSESMRLPVLIDTAAKVVRARSGAAAAASGDFGDPGIGACTVTLARPIEIALDRWSNRFDVGCDLAGGVAVTVDPGGDVSAEPGDVAAHEHTVFPGRLLALGRGHAVRLDII